jgi:hypothetical protein
MWRGCHPIHVDAKPLGLGNGFGLLLAIVLDFPLVGLEASEGQGCGSLSVNSQSGQRQAGSKKSGDHALERVLRKARNS